MLSVLIFLSFSGKQVWIHSFPSPVVSIHSVDDDGQLARIPLQNVAMEMLYSMLESSTVDQMALRPFHDGAEWNYKDKDKKRDLR